MRNINEKTAGDKRPTKDNYLNVTYIDEAINNSLKEFKDNNRELDIISLLSPKGEKLLRELAEQTAVKTLNLVKKQLEDLLAERKKYTSLSQDLSNIGIEESITLIKLMDGGRALENG